MLRIKPLLFIAIFIIGCNKPKTDYLKAEGEILFPFSYEDVTLFQWSIHDPTKNIRFDVNFTKDLKSRPGRKAHWKIEMPPESEIPLIDSFADAHFLEKLLDYFSTLKVQEVISDGDPQNYGLRPFHYAFRFQTPDFQFELILGEKIKNSFARYAQFQIIPKDKKTRQRWDAQAIYLIDGVALKYLDQKLQAFEDIRLKKIFPEVMDDFIHFTYAVKTKKIFEAERNGASFQLIHGAEPINGIKNFLETIFQMEILEFYENEKKIKDLKLKFSKSTVHTLELKSRKNESNTLRWMEVGDGNWIAETSFRPGLFFLLNSPSQN